MELKMLSRNQYKVRKERNRRERINRSIKELERLLKTEDESRLEKADILEQTIQIIRSNSNCHTLDYLNEIESDPRFSEGYNVCIQEVKRFLINDTVQESVRDLIKQFAKQYDDRLQQQHKQQQSMPTSSIKSNSRVLMPNYHLNNHIQCVIPSTNSETFTKREVLQKIRKFILEKRKQRIRQIMINDPYQNLTNMWRPW